MCMSLSAGHPSRCEDRIGVAWPSAGSASSWRSTDGTAGSDTRTAPRDGRPCGGPEGSILPAILRTSPPVRRDGPRYPIGTPHFPQNASSGSTRASHAGQPYSIRLPHLPQNRSEGPRTAPQEGHGAASRAGSFAAHSAHIKTKTPRWRTGFQPAVRRPHSAHARSRDADASTTRISGFRSSGREGGVATRLGTASGREKPFGAYFPLGRSITMFLRRGAASGASSSRYVR